MADNPKYAPLRRFNFANQTNPVFLCIVEKAKYYGVGYRYPFSYPNTGLFGLNYDPSGSTNIVMALHVLEARRALERCAARLAPPLDKAAYLTGAIGKPSWTDDWPNAVSSPAPGPAVPTVADTNSLNEFTKQPEKNVWYEELERACNYLGAPTGLDNPLVDHTIVYSIPNCVKYGVPIAVDVIVRNKSTEYNLQNIRFPEIFKTSPQTGVVIQEGPLTLGPKVPARLIVRSGWTSVVIKKIDGSEFPFTNLDVKKTTNYITGMPISSLGVQVKAIPIPPGAIATFRFVGRIAASGSFILNPFDVGKLNRIQLGDLNPAYRTAVDFDDGAGQLLTVTMPPNDTGQLFLLDDTCTGTNIPPDRPPPPPPPGDGVVSVSANGGGITTCEPSAFVVNISVSNGLPDNIEVSAVTVKFEWTTTGTSVAGFGTVDKVPPNSLVPAGTSKSFKLNVTYKGRDRKPDGGAAIKMTVTVNYNVVGGANGGGAAVATAENVIFAAEGCPEETDPVPPPGTEPPTEEPPYVPDDVPSQYKFGFYVDKSVVLDTFNSSLPGSAVRTGNKQIYPHDPAIPNSSNSDDSVTIYYTFINPFNFPIRVTILPEDVRLLGQSEINTSLTTGLPNYVPKDVTDQFVVTAPGPTTAILLPLAGIERPSPTIAFTARVNATPSPSLGVVTVDCSAVGTALDDDPDGVFGDASWKSGDTIYPEPGGHGYAVIEPDYFEVIYKTPTFQSGELSILASSAAPTTSGSRTAFTFVITYTVKNNRSAGTTTALRLMTPNLRVSQGNGQSVSLNNLFDFTPITGLPTTLAVGSTTPISVRATLKTGAIVPGYVNLIELQGNAGAELFDRPGVDHIAFSSPVVSPGFYQVTDAPVAPPGKMSFLIGNPTPASVTFSSAAAVITGTESVQRGFSALVTIYNNTLNSVNVRPQVRSRTLGTDMQLFPISVNTTVVLPPGGTFAEVVTFALRMNQKTSGNNPQPYFCPKTLTNVLVGTTGGDTGTEPPPANSALFRLNTQTINFTRTYSGVPGVTDFC